MAGIPQKDTTTLRHVAPYIMAGNSITFVPAHRTEDIESNGGFAPTSCHTVDCQARQNCPVTPGQREETDTGSMFCLLLLAPSPLSQLMLTLPFTRYRFR